jgi:diaminopimelate epimerase
MHFVKYHALGNDYLVIEPAELPAGPTPSLIRLICDRHLGVGSDGLLMGPLAAAIGDFALRLFNPDGSEFEKSGNGLRIFARYLWDRELVNTAPFTILTPGGIVTAQVHSGGRGVTVHMGQVSFASNRIPVTGPAREVVDETMVVGGQALRVSAATIGNPHCVVLRDAVSAEEARRLGPLIEHDERFPNRTNVQFMQVLDRQHIRIEIWERGAGYTLSSGSSSCAAAAVAHRLGLCDRQVTVATPGGAIAIAIDDTWSITMSGAVTRICEGIIAHEALADL